MFFQGAFGEGTTSQCPTSYERHEPSLLLKQGVERTDLMLGLSSCYVILRLNGVKPLILLAQPLILLL